MTTRSRIISLFCLVSLLILLVAQAQAAPLLCQLNYQGYLTNSAGNPVPNGNYTMTFRLYNISTGGTHLWIETKDVAVTNGVFNTLLGDTTTLSPGIFYTGQALWLGIKVGGDAEMTPRQTITLVGYAINADTVDGSHASSFASAGHNHWHAAWSGSGVGLSLNSSDDVAIMADGDDAGGAFYGATMGVYAEATGVGVTGEGGTAGGYFNDKTSGESYAYIAYGNYGILSSGTKSFIHEVPATTANKSGDSDGHQAIIYAALEGGEAGTYYRGSAQLTNGEAVIALPEHFTLVTEAEGLTVQVTPRTDCNGVYVAEVSTSSITVKELQGGTSNAQFDFLINGIRQGFTDFKVYTTMEEMGFDKMNVPEQPEVQE